MGATNPPWKKFERALARDVGTERIPVTGERDGADFENAMFSYSAKFRKAAISKDLSGWLDRVETKGRATGRVGVLVVRRHRRPRRDAAVILTWGDWLDLHGDKPASEPAYVLSDKAVRHVKTGCPLPPGHVGPCETPAGHVVAVPASGGEPIAALETEATELRQHIYETAGPRCAVLVDRLLAALAARPAQEAP